MSIKRYLKLRVVLLTLTLPLMFMTGSANAVVFNSDGAQHDDTQASGWALPTDVGACFDGTSTIDTSKTTKFDCRNVALPGQTTKSACTDPNSFINPIGYDDNVSIARWSACSKGGYGDATTCAAASGTFAGFAKCDQFLIAADCALAGGTYASSKCTTTALSVGACAAGGSISGTATSWMGSAAVSGGVTTCSLYVGDQASCTAAAGVWSTANTDETRGYCGGNWIFKTKTGANADHQNCLRCHNSNYMYDPNRVEAATGKVKPYGPAKESYLLGGHKNMSRPVDGLKWGMPGVTALTPFLGNSGEASLDSDGFFTSLWIKEDYPKMLVNWAGKTLSQGYCGYTATGNTDSSKLPDLIACPTCESPIFGDGNAGYPLGYADQVTCINAKNPATGSKDFSWYANANKPLYWIYGGAGLEGGPPMYEPGAQNYKCGRCHTSGWSADVTADHVTGLTGVKDTKLPFNATSTGGMFEGADFTTQTVAGGTAKLVDPSIGGYQLSSFDRFGIQCSRCHVAKDDGHTTWPSVGTAGQAGKTTGGDVVAMCMTCHRMEGDPEPRAVAGSINGGSANYNAATPFTNKAAQPDGFAHHPDGPEFLNSVHSQFTGTWGQIGCPPLAISGYGDTATRAGDPYGTSLSGKCTPGTMNSNGATSSQYASKFAQAVVSDLGVNSSTAGGCTSCHNVHEPYNNNVAGMSKSVEVGCVECHVNASATVSPQIDPLKLNHPAGVGTPLAAGSGSCNICHQPAGIKHIWRISTDANYRTYGDYNTAATMAGGDPTKVNLPPTAADGAYANAVWVDLDNACGQCHGGGVSQSNITTTTTATISGAVSSVTVSNASGFASGREIQIAGAGVAGADFKTIIAKVAGNTVYLTYATAVSHPDVAPGATVTVAGNPTANGAPYRTKAELAPLAAMMHGLNPVARFTTAPTTTSYMVKFDATNSICPSGTCSYTWNFDTYGSGTGVTTSNLFTGYTGTIGVPVTLTVADGQLTSSVTHIVIPSFANHIPVALGLRDSYTGTTTLNATVVTNSSNSVAFTDRSTDVDNNVKAVSVIWGDGIVTTQPATGGLISHSYTKAGTFTIIHTVTDLSGAGNTERATVKIVPPVVTVSGLVTNNVGKPLSMAKVTLKRGLTTRTAYTNYTGTYKFTRTLPGIWTITATKTGYTFSGSVTVNAPTESVAPTITAN